MNFHYYLLINPAAGSGAGKKVAEKMIPLFAEKSFTIRSNTVSIQGMMLKLPKS